MAKVVGDSDNIAGGNSSALQTDFPTSVDERLLQHPEGREVIEGDFVRGVIGDETHASRRRASTSSRSRRSTTRPIGGRRRRRVVMFKDNPVAKAFIEYLTTPEASEIWAARAASRRRTRRSTRASIRIRSRRRRQTPSDANAEVFRFDLSDLLPSAFGSTRSSRCSRTSWRTRTTSTGSEEDGGGGRDGVRLVEAMEGREQHGAGGAARRGGSPAELAPARGASTRCCRSLPRPGAAAALRLDRLSDDRDDLPQLLRRDAATSSSGSTTTN